MNRADALLERARRKAGLEDFGRESFREGLERLIHSIDTEALLTQTGMVVFETSVANSIREGQPLTPLQMLAADHDERRRGLPIEFTPGPRRPVSETAPAGSSSREE